MNGYNIVAACDMVDSNKALFLKLVDDVSIISDRTGIPLRKVMIDFLAQYLHAAEAIAAQGEGIEQFHADLRKAIDSYA